MNGPQHEQEHFCLTPMLMCFVLFVSHVPQHIPEATSCPSSLEVADPRLDTRGGPEQQGCMSFAQASQKGGVYISTDGVSKVLGMPRRPQP